MFYLSKMYDMVEDPENVSELYNDVVATALTDLSIGKTKVYKRRGF